MRLLNVQQILGGMAPSGPIPDNRTLIRSTLTIAWPSMLEAFLIALVTMVDTMMVGSLGSYAIAAVGLTTQPKFIGLAFFLSLNVAVSALVARRRGEQDRENANQILRQALAIVLIATAIVSTLCLAFADQILWLAGAAEDTHVYAASYFRIVMGGILFNTVSLVINAAQRGAGNTRIALRSNMVSNGVNIVFNYLLIGGHFGFPQLGVSGAAIATVIGSACGCAMSLRSVSHHGAFLHLFERVRFAFDRRTLQSIANIGSSTLAEQVFMRIGFLSYAFLVARLGTVAFAAHQVGMNMMNLSFSFGDGLASAAIALVGQSLGAERQDLAKIYGSICQRTGLLCSCAMSVLFVTMNRQMFLLYTNEEPVLAYGPMIMTLLSFITFLQISQVIFSGCLRGAGDATFVAMVSLLSVTFIRPIVGWLFCYPLHLGLFGAWIGLVADQLVRLLLTMRRFRSGRWASIKL